MKQWIHAFRLRTLPLAFSCIIVGCGLAYADDSFSLQLAILLLMTTLFLQVLSNLANDYGDFVKGTDNDSRVGPVRALQSGSITKPQMIKAIGIVAGLCALSGAYLIFEGTKGLPLYYVGIFVIMGLLSIGAAIKYSVGNSAYGYAGMGDIAVFIFFGWIGVIGSYFLQTHTLRWNLLLPATSIGLLSTAVLNINNMRDHVEDQKCGKHTLATRLGLKRAKQYHLLLNICAILAMVVYETESNIMLSSGLVLFIPPALKISFSKNHEYFDPFLKTQALGTFIHSVIFVYMLYRN